MKTASLAILFCLTMPTLAPAQEAPPAEAKIVLVAPDSARVGELVRLDVSESSADSFKWILVPDSDDFLTYDAGARAVFSARAQGEYRFVIACAKDESVDVITHVVKIIGPPSEPTSNSLADWIPYWHWKNPLPESELRQMAVSFEKIAARTDLDTPGDWQAATAEANRAILGDRIEAWKPLLEKIGASLHNKAQAGDLTTPEQHAETWLEIAEGLRNCYGPVN